MKKSVAPRPLPPGTLVLVTPWQNDGNGEYVGLPSDPLLRQITELAELEGSVPRLSGCFLSWHNEPVFGDSRYTDAISGDHPTQHGHRITHTHSAKLLGAGYEGSAEIDDDDNNRPRSYASIDHKHDVTLERDSVTLAEESRQHWFEPIHYELSAFLVDDQGQSTAVPAGMVAFRDDNLDSLPGWQRMDLEPFRRDPREPDPTYGPRRWTEGAFKVVGCTPSKHRLGTLDHTHEIPSHDHRNRGTVTGSNGAQGDADDSSGSTSVAQLGHGHSISSVSTAVGSLTSAPNLRRHRTMTVWVAREDEVEVPEGMLIPYIPADRQMLHNLYVFGPDAFRPAYESTANMNDPVFVTSGDFIGGDQPGALKGENNHTHKLTHGHLIKVGTTPDTVTKDYDRDDIIVAAGGHKHAPVYVEQTDESTEIINPIRYRRVMFIRKT